MANVLSSMVAALAGYSGLSAMVGTRIFPAVAESLVAWPYCVYTTVFSSPQNNLDGWSGVDNTHVQISIWSKSYAEAHAVADQVRLAMAQPNSAYRSTCASVIDGPVGGGLDLYHVITEFSLWSI